MGFRLLICLGLLCVLGGFQPACTRAESKTATLTCQSYLLYDLTSESVVDSFNAERQQPIASLTKLMTAILACERLRFDGRYRLSASEAQTFGVTTMRVDKMLELMLIPSNNSICKVVARLVSGSEEAFVREMNARARELGLVDTSYANASGLPGGEQQSSILDVLILSRVALTYPPIRHAMGLAEMELAGKRYEGTLKPLYDRHPGLLAGKTGYTRTAGRCLVLLYEYLGRQFLLITLKSDGVDEGFRDAELLLSRYGLYGGEVGTWD